MENLMTTNVGFEKNGKITYFLNLSHNSKRELFFRILWKKDLKPSYYFDGVTNQEIRVSSLDHISFHEDGTVHLRYYNNRKKPAKTKLIKYKNLIKDMPMNTYAPLFILSIYNADTIQKFLGSDDPLEFNEQSNLNYKFELENANSFSLAFFLVSGDVDCAKMSEVHFPETFIRSASPVLLNYFGDEDKVCIENDVLKRSDDLSLYIGYTKKVIKRPPTNLLIGPNNKEITKIDTDFLGFRIAQSDNSINSLVIE